MKQLEVTAAVKTMEKFFSDLRKKYTTIPKHDRVKDYLNKCLDVNIERKKKLQETSTNKELDPFEKNMILPYFKLKEIINYRNSFNHYIDLEQKEITHQHNIDRHQELLMEGHQSWTKFCENFYNDEYFPGYLYALIHITNSSRIMY